MSVPALSENVLRRRREAGLSRARLAKAADTSLSTIVRLERGHVPTVAILRRIAAALGTTVAELLTEDAA